MKKLLPGFCLLLLPALAPAGPAATRPGAAPVTTRATSPDEQLFTNLVDEVSAAIEKKDMPALEALMAPDYIHYNPGNGVGHKTDETAFIATWPPTTIKPVGPVQVSRSGNMAVTVSQHVYSFTENGKTTSRAIQHMIAWSQHNGKWQMTIVQSKDVPA